MLQTADSHDSTARYILLTSAVSGVKNEVGHLIEEGGYWGQPLMCR